MKGKAAVQNANRRTAEAFAQVDELKSQLAAEKAARRADVNQLSDELRAARGALESEVEDRAAARVTAVETRWQSASDEAGLEARRRAVEALELLINNTYKLAVPVPLALKIAEALGVPDAVEMNDSGPCGRQERRNGRYRRKELAEQNSAYVGGIKKEPTFGAPAR